MKILLILSRNPFPAKAGREKMIIQIIRFLNMHSELKIMCFDTGGPFHEIIRFCNENSIDILKLELPSKIRVLKNLITERSFSLQESLYYSNTIKEQINKFCSEFQPNYVYCDMIRTGVNLRDINVPVIMDFDDLLSVRYNKLLKENRSFIGTYSKVLVW